jgi:hypothetical protein
MNPRYPQVAARGRHRCEYCRAPEVIFNFPFEVEHVVPVSLGGGDAEENLALACRACNLHKANHLEGTDSETGAPERLFHPRLDAWDDHFHVDPETGVISGVTAIGRSTVFRLQMNNETQLAARRQWMRLGLFP